MFQKTDVTQELIVIEGGARRQLATCGTMYHQWPEDGEPFVEIRQWGTLDGDQGEIVAEWGHVDAAGDLQTDSAVLPYWWDLQAVLTFVNEQLAGGPGA